MKRSRYPFWTGAPWGACLFLAAAVLAATGGVAGASTLGRGDFDFYLDTAMFRGREGKVLTDVSIRVHNRSLHFNDRDSKFQNRSKLQVLITSDAGKDVVKQSETVTFVETDRERVDSPLAFQTVIKQYDLAPGGYWLSYSIEDLDAPKITLVGLTRGKHKTSVVRRVRLNVPEIPEDEASFSSALFVWRIDPNQLGVRRYVPNPPRMYGLYRDSLFVYMELYLPDEMAQAHAFEFQTEIVTPTGEVVRTAQHRLPNPAPSSGETRAYPVVIRDDLTTLPALGYTLYISFGLDGQTVSRVKAGEFSVAWDIRTWEVPRREFLAEARFLLGDDDFASFQTRSQGEQEQILDARWLAHDPDPSTSANEARDRFLERLDYINAHYSEGGVAIFTARGDVFARFGAPDELVQDVVPENYETLAEAEQAVENPYHPLNFSSSGSKPYSIPKSRNSIAGEGSSARYRPEDNTGVPYELWVYHGGGDPILARDRVQNQDIGIRFLFVDRDGHGQYKLEKSSSITTK